MNCAETTEEVNERLNKFEKEIDSVEPDQVNDSVEPDQVIDSVEPDQVNATTFFYSICIAFLSRRGWRLF